MKPKVSIVLSCYNRGRQLEKTLDSIKKQDYEPLEVVIVEDGYDGGWTERAAKFFGAKYYGRKNRPDLPAFQNPSRIHNIGIRQAEGDIIILQGGEVKYDTIPDGISKLVAPVLLNPKSVTSPYVQSLDKEGKFSEWFIHKDSPRGEWIINFCLAVRREHLLYVGGFDETYFGYGCEDDQLMFCLREIGCRTFCVPEVVVSHQWHERRNYEFYNPDNVDQLNRFIARVRAGDPPWSNVGKPWGRIYGYDPL